MRFSGLFSILFVNFAVALVEPDEEGVLVLDDNNFDQALSENENLLVEFYAPWCGHCKSLAPHWARAAKSLVSEPVKLAKCDATIATKLAERFGIRGFPTIKFFKYGQSSEYGGGRTAPEIINWVTKKIGPPTTTLATAEDLDEIDEANDVFVLGVFSSSDSPASKVFSEIAATDDTLTYASTTSSEVKDRLAVSGDAIIIIKDFDEKRADLQIGSVLDIEAARKFIAGNSIPLVQEFSMESSKKIFSSSIKKHVLFFTSKSKEHHTPTVKVFSEVANEWKGQVLVVNVPSSEEKVLDFFGIKTEDLPVMILADMGGEGQMKKYPYSGAISQPEVSSFLSKYFEGGLEPTLKSEVVLPEDTTGDVVILKGSSFNDLVINNTKDVLVEFYAPWCGHCKKLEPTWNALGAALKKSKDVVIAKMDATANEIDVKGVEVRGYPSIFFFKGSDKSKPVKYESGREVSDFIQYLKENGSNTVEHDEL